MADPIRVLQVLGTTGLGGAESRVMDSYRNMDRTRIQFDFAVHSSKEGYFDGEITALGGNIYRLPRFKGYNVISYRKAWKDFFLSHPGYVCVHGHMTSTACFYLPIAKKAGVARTAAHARSAGTDKGARGMLTRLLRKKLWKKTDFCLACSALAGQAVFGKKAWELGKVHVIPNAIEVEKYAYNAQKRKEMREQLGLSKKLVIGHVGRFNAVKNHLFLLDIFEKIHEKRPDSVLLLLGEGDCMEAAKQKAAEQRLSGDVIFAGNQGNVQDYYQAMDFLVFPSLYEGLPGTVLEAQAAGLPCLMSDTITEEVMLTGLVEAMSLTKSAEKWAENVLRRTEEAAGYARKDHLEEIRKAGFDVKQQAGCLALFYERGEPLWN